MSLIADALQPSIIRELIATSGRPKSITVPDIIISPLSGYTLAFDRGLRSIDIDFGFADTLVDAWAADLGRLSSASFQTISLVSAQVSERDNVAWCLVKLYYAAFYAGHAFMRVFGEGGSYFDGQHVAQLNRVAVALGTPSPFTIDRGLYHCALQPNPSVLKCARIRSRSSAAHEAFWEMFGRTLDGLATNVLRGPLIRSEAQAVFKQLDDLKNILNRKPNCGWLSFVRNEVQYRQRFDVWFPKQMRAATRTTLKGLANEWSRDPMDIDLQARGTGLLGEFVTCCALMVALCHAMVLRLTELSSAGMRSFTRFGPIAFLNDIRPRSAAAPN
jgi:hypothetical protein